MKISAEINAKIRNEEVKILRYTPQIFIGIERERYIVPHPEASAVLLELGEQHFLLTAGHVLDNEENLGFALEGKFYPISDEFFYYYNKSTDTLNHKVDIGVVRLNQDIIDAFKNSGFNFLKYSQLSLSQPYSPGNCYLLAGYPANRKKLKISTGSFSCTPFFLSTREVIDDFKKLKVLKDYKLLLNYQKRKIINPHTGDKIQGPNLKGVSGSGIWYLNNGMSTLAGIFTDWHMDYNLLAATRIEVLIEAIRQSYMINIPKIENEFLENMIKESFII